jgi:integrase
VNPIKGLTWPDLPEGIERYLTPSEVEAITFHMSKPINRLIVWTTVTSGMRAGEIGGLHIPRIDLVRGGIEVIEQYDQAFNIIKPLPKDDQKRYVPIPMDVAEMLADHIKTLPKAKNCGVEHESGRCPGGVLPFRGPRNAPFRSSEWGKGPWQAALDLAEIEGRVRFHDLRHTFASWAIQRGVPFGDLAEVMGHSSWEVTKKYAHLAENRHDTVREALTKGYTEARGAARGAQAGVTQLSPVSPGAAENSA